MSIKWKKKKCSVRTVPGMKKVTIDVGNAFPTLTHFNYEIVKPHTLSRYLLEIYFSKSRACEKFLIFLADTFCKLEENISAFLPWFHSDSEESCG